MTILRSDYSTCIYAVSLYYIRLVALITSVIIVIGSIGFHSMNSIPLDIPILKEQLADNNIWFAQGILDRRLISTLVAAQASIFCLLFTLIAEVSVEISDSMVETACYFLMPLGLAICWLFSILFDIKSAEIVINGSLCLMENNCSIFLLLHCLKYLIISLFTLEPCIVGIICCNNYSENIIQLPLDEEGCERGTEKF